MNYLKWEEFMNNEKKITRISKFLSLVLRHKPEEAGIELDEQGWTDMSILLQKMQEKGIAINEELLKYVVETNTKKRFAFNETGDKIRANQGHSVMVELGYTAQQPPDMLYHGTAIKYLDAIMKEGLQKQSRHHVHLSADEETAAKVGQRHGKAVILKIMSGEMYRNGLFFYLSDNDVWLTDHVPVAYIRK